MSGLPSIGARMFLCMRSNARQGRSGLAQNMRDSLRGIKPGRPRGANLEISSRVKIPDARQHSWLLP